VARDAAGGVGGAEEDVRVNGKKIGGATTRVSPLSWLPSSVWPGGYCSIRWLDTAPWLAMIGLGFGIAAGFVNPFRAVKRH
jgi:hypothetical protein